MFLSLFVIPSLKFTYFSVEFSYDETILKKIRKAEMRLQVSVNQNGFLKLTGGTLKLTENNGSLLSHQKRKHMPEKSGKYFKKSKQNVSIMHYE